MSDQNGPGEAYGCKSRDLTDVVSFVKVCGDLSFFLTLFHGHMQTLTNEEGIGLNEHSANTTSDARHASNVGIPLTDSQAEFWYLVECQGSRELAHSLKMVHDFSALSFGCSV
ncbi:hypothetical protein [Dyadobacter sp. MSC1_007]|jgi:hypothetical protein|uniref:hypothetical protein n=1 Tax=Dyadobacter sp. MSC1_007 TaxID=2909264 RepID=UPI00202E4112|nr:hypothetical protein [Dyadobacter sp. MSC1_007]